MSFAHSKDYSIMGWKLNLSTQLGYNGLATQPIDSIRGYNGLATQPIDSLGYNGLATHLSTQLGYNGLSTQPIDSTYNNIYMVINKY